VPSQSEEIPHSARDHFALGQTRLARVTTLATRDGEHRNDDAEDQDRHAFAVTRHPLRMAPLCQAEARRRVAFRRGPGCGLTEEPAIGVGPATLVIGVVPACPPGPRIASSSATSWR